jgi:CubicO group peptidase (beta-lactamase class C family)
MTEVHGFCDELFSPLRALLESNLADGTDVGASLAVTHGGEYVADLWGGTSDWGLSKPWERHTLVRVFSSSKPMLIAATLLMVDRGLLDLHAPIAQYWPEFARHGKGAITTRQVLVHQSGLPGFGQTVSFADLSDWDRTIAIIEDAEPWFEPGSTFCYSPHVFGYVLGEVVRRVSGRAIDEVCRTEFIEPLGAEFHFPLTDPLAHVRVADLWPDESEPAESEIGARLMTEMQSTGEWVQPECFSAMLPAACGITNGRALARLSSMFAMGGELDGRRYLSRSIIQEASREQAAGEDVVLGPIRYGLGFGLDNPTFPAPTPTTFHWGGYGGSFITMDTETGLSCGFTPNKLRQAEFGAERGRLARYVATLGEVSRSLV